MGLQKPVITPGNCVGAGDPNFTNQAIPQPYESLFLRVPIRNKMEKVICAYHSHLSKGPKLITIEVIKINVSLSEHTKLQPSSTETCFNC